MSFYKQVYPNAIPPRPNNFFRIVGKNKVISILINQNPNNHTISISNYKGVGNVKFIRESSEACTEEEYTNAYNEAMAQIDPKKAELNKSWLGFECAPLEFFHQTLFELFHNFRENQVDVENPVIAYLNGMEMNDIIVEAKKATYKKYAAYLNNKAISKDELEYKFCRHCTKKLLPIESHLGGGVCQDCEPKDDYTGSFTG